MEVSDNLMRTQLVMKVKNSTDFGLTPNLNRTQVLKRHSLAIMQDSKFFDQIRKNKMDIIELSLVQSEVIEDIPRRSDDRKESLADVMKILCCMNNLNNS